jgi:uncharacterized protein YdeI (YjbR/CyaY-like superfamily)
MDDDVKSALDANHVLDKFISLAPSHKREYINWIDAAKKPDTRIRRIQKMCKMLMAQK